MPTPVRALVIAYSGNLDPAACERLTQAASDAANSGVKEVHLRIRSNGGYVEDAIELFNTLRAFPLKLITYNTYRVNSAALIAFLAGDERNAARGSTFYLHRNSSGAVQGLSVEGARELASDMSALDDRVRDLIADRTGTDAAQVGKWISKGTMLSAEEAFVAGLVSAVGDRRLPARHQFTTIRGS